jgi:hypothetical protein
MDFHRFSAPAFAARVPPLSLSLTRLEHVLFQKVQQREAKFLWRCSPVKRGGIAGGRLRCGSAASAI